MAWTGIFLGTIAGLAAAVAGYVLLGLPLWACLLLYPLTGVLTATAVIAVLYLHSRSTPPAPHAAPAQRSAAA